jgi:pyruvate dehydrogenase E1 component alpha subunit
VDGNDVVAVRTACVTFLEDARRGEGPFLLECLTHRLRGHYEGDPQRYRQALADEEWQELDPILRLQRLGLADGWLDDEAPARLEQQAREEVEEAVRFAQASPFPDPALTAELVYRS